MEEWHDLFVATSGSAAALTGLIFVGISINIKEILAHSSLPTRASLALLLLMGILVSSIALLLPIEIRQAGFVIIVPAILFYVTITRKDYRIYHDAQRKYKLLFLVNVAFDQLASLPYIVGSILLVLSNGTGLYWIVFAFAVSFAKAVSDAWVLIIEILR